MRDKNFEELSPHISPIESPIKEAEIGLQMNVRVVINVFKIQRI